MLAWILARGLDPHGQAHGPSNTLTENLITKVLDFVQFGERKGPLLLAWESNAVLSCPVSLP